MRIADSKVAMSARSDTVKTHTREESLKIWINGRMYDFKNKNSASGKSSESSKDIITISDGAKNHLAQTSECAVYRGNESSIELKISENDKQKLQLLQKMFEALTGKKLKFYIPKEIKIETHQAQPVLYTVTRHNSQATNGWGLEYNYSESYYERQTLAFNSEGIIKTIDGREIKFSVELNTSREFASRVNINTRRGEAVSKDPLVMNFDGTIPSITDEKIGFDIDCDGSDDLISFLSSGSGFLALDLNGDGTINDGSELFGPQSGDGFAELAKYDFDGNNWIDENDPIYEKLRIWTRDDKGNDVLLALGQKGIGAIYLGNVNTLFDIKNRQNELQGKIQKTGIFVNENGTTGTIQHIDIAL
ncbi:MAG: hypothetical protein NUV45_10780 [Tepidanaerobacteraceae bacterium]|nr:hypothetical protein [Tepidanaerobacteraceae bacterium]